MYFLFGKFFGWTPKEVDEIDWKLVVDLSYLLNQYLSSLSGGGVEQKLLELAEMLREGGV